MIVLDNKGHWLDGPLWGHWCQEFIPIECPEQPDEHFTEQIVEAIRNSKIRLDGLVTFCDKYRVTVAAAAEQLGLPTYPPEVFENVTNKYKLSVSEGQPTYRASSYGEAEAVIRDNELTFPLIIKPSLMGYQSEGVYRVENFKQLETAMQCTDTTRHGKEWVIQNYCRGPEVDASFVIWKGKPLFFEASDELPKAADDNCQQGSQEDGHLRTFLELGNILPSDLSASEIAMIRDSLCETLLRMNLTDGIYHLEARVQDSQVEYQIRDDMWELVPRDASVETKKQPSAWLLEINPRPPGIQAADAIKHTYGIDYWGLALLFALEDHQRVRQLAYPFTQGHQYWSYMVFLPVSKGGICKSDDPCADLFSRRPDLRAHVSWWCTFWKKDEVIPDPRDGHNTWIAHINVFSTESRAHVLTIGEAIREEIHFVIV